MTICISVQVAEGLVFAADSMTALQGTMMTPQGPATGLLQTFASANKIAQVKDYPIGVMSWGLAAIGDRTIQSLIMEFEYGYSSAKSNTNYQTKTIAEELVSFIRDRYTKLHGAGTPQLALGLAIGGHSSNQFFAEQYTIEFPAQTDLRPVRPEKPGGVPTFGANWFGMTDALLRLIKGWDPVALNELVNRGADQKIVQKWIDDAVGELPIVFDGMPITDAIDFANYAAQVVIGRHRFGAGPQLCGGDVDVAVMRPGTFEWAHRKRWAIKRYEGVSS